MGAAHVKRSESARNSFESAPYRTIFRTMGGTVERRRVLIWALALLCLTAVSVATLDQFLAVALADSVPVMKAFVRPWISAIEIASGFSVSKWFAGCVLVAGALLLFATRRYPRSAWVLLFIGISQLATRLAAGVLKNVFERPRPYDALAGTGWKGEFFTGGSSFPSGHAAHFWPFFFAAAIAFPRYRWPFLLVALFVSLARVAVNDHYVGDVTASAAIAAFVVYGLSSVFEKRFQVQEVGSDASGGAQAGGGELS